MKQKIDYKINYYEVLGVNQDATLADIKSKYRKLAQHNHPDKNHNSKSLDVFLLIKEAYTVLSDADLRKMYDSKFVRRNKKVLNEFKLEISFKESIDGVKINTHIGIIDIPKGIRDREKLHFLDNIIEVVITPDPMYVREGNNLYTNIKVDSLLAIVGGKLNFTKLCDGDMVINIPRGTQNGDVLQFAGHGAYGRDTGSYGDLYLKCLLTTPLLTDEIITDILSIASLSKYK